MASPFVTRNGGRRVDTCCNFNCRQSRDCPARQACELPEDDASKPSFLASRWVWIGGALSLTAWAAIAYFA